MQPRPIEIAGRRIALDTPPYVIAEAGVHHDNDMERAKQLILAARDAGADAVKFQTYSADRLAARWAPTYWDDGSGRTQHDIFSERSLFGLNEYRALFNYAADLGITLLSTPFDTDAVAMLAGLGMEAFKIASADITDHPLLEACAVHGKPVLMSTGASTMDEVQAAVALVSSHGAPVSLLHCSLAYPTPLEHANLGRLSLLAETFPEVLLGYSDHVQPQDSELPCPIAVSFGAQVIEKHFTLDKSLPGDDHYHAVNPDGLARLVVNCRDAWLMSRNEGEMTDSEQAAREFARRSIVAARDLVAGTVITADDIDFKRPGTGMSPARSAEVIGRRLIRSLVQDELISLAATEDYSD